MSDFINIDIKRNEVKTINFEQTKNISFNVHEGATLNIYFALFDNLCDSIEIKGDVHQSGTVNIVFADFCLSNLKVKSDIKLVGMHSSCFWDLASLSLNNNKKIFDISVSHLASFTTAFMNNHGVARDKSSLVFTGVNFIANKAKKSNSKQNNKIIVFDEGVKAKADPILKIDENDVLASHAAVVGRLNEEHIFYLCSRGLSLLEAKQLITYGYLKPIGEKFGNEEIKNKILNVITEAV